MSYGTQWRQKEQGNTEEPCFQKKCVMWLNKWDGQVIIKPVYLWCAPYVLPSHTGNIWNLCVVFFCVFCSCVHDKGLEKLERHHQHSHPDLLCWLGYWWQYYGFQTTRVRNLSTHVNSLLKFIYAIPNQYRVTEALLQNDHPSQNLNDSDFRVQVIKLRAFQFMVPHCSAYKCLPFDKKQFPVNLEPYEGRWKESKERRQAKLESMNKRIKRNENLSSLESAIQAKERKIKKEHSNPSTTQPISSNKSPT